MLQRWWSLGRVLIGLVIAASFATSCVRPSNNDGSPAATPSVTAKPAPQRTPTSSAQPSSAATPKAGTPTPEPRLAFEAATRKLQEAKSYRFSIEAVHKTSAGDWRYTGEGAFAAPNKFRSTLRGQADVTFVAVYDGQRAYCADTRGEQSACSVAWGGPAPGTSAYLALAYVRFPLKIEALSGLGATADEWRFRFVPELTTVAAQNKAFTSALSSVQGVTGELTVDPASMRPRQERLVVNLQEQGRQAETVELLLRFHDYDQPVEISIPPSPGR